MRGQALLSQNLHSGWETCQDWEGAGRGQVMGKDGDWRPALTRVICDRKSRL